MMNSPREMLERLAYVIWLVITGASVCMIFLSAVMGFEGSAAALFLGGVAGILASRLLHTHGHKHWHFDECTASLEYLSQETYYPGTLEHENRANSLRKVFHDWEELEIEGPMLHGDDVWRRHALRREAQSILDADPALRQEFQYEISQRPELDCIRRN